SDANVPLPNQARDFALLPEVSPQTIDQIGFHEKVKSRAVPLLRDGHLVAAVREAAVALYDIIRERSGIDEDATTLITRVFRGAGKVLKFVNIAPSHIENADEGLIGYLESFSKHTR